MNDLRPDKAFVQATFLGYTIWAAGSVRTVANSTECIVTMAA